MDILLENPSLFQVVGSVIINQSNLIVANEYMSFFSMPNFLFYSNFKYHYFLSLVSCVNTKPVLNFIWAFPLRSISDTHTQEHEENFDSIDKYIMVNEICVYAGSTNKVLYHSSSTFQLINKVHLVQNLLMWKPLLQSPMVSPGWICLEYLNVSLPHPTNHYSFYFYCSQSSVKRFIAINIQLCHIKMFDNYGVPQLRFCIP